MSGDGAAPPLPALLSLNVNGIRDASRRRALFSALLRGPWQVIVLLETHCEGDEEARRWVQEGAGPGMPWQGSAYWCHGPDRRRGVGVLVHHSWAGQLLGWTPSTHTCEGELGRVLCVRWQPPAAAAASAPLAVVGVYAPVEAPLRRAFFGPAGPLSQVLSAGAAGPATAIVAGDFNCVLEVRDVLGTPGPRGGGRMIGGSELLQLMAAFGLVDAWRHCQPAGVEATHTAPRQGGVWSAGRIDMCLVSVHAVHRGWLRDCSHLHGQLPVGDHAGVQLRLRDPALPSEGAGAWRFPVPLLQDAAFRLGLRAAVTDMAAAWVPGHPAAAAAPAGHKWEAIKRRIQLYCKHYIQCQRRERRQQGRAEEALISETVAALAQPSAQAGDAAAEPDAAAAAQPGVAPPAGLPAAAYRVRVAARQGAVQEAAEQQHQAAMALWQRYGEQGTKWFHRLGRKPQPQVPLVAVARPDGTVARLADEGGKAAMDAAIADYFTGPQGVFATPHAHAGHSAAVLASVEHTVPPQLHSLVAGPDGDGSVTVACVLEALKACPPGKAPGSDGLPYELFTALGDCLLEHMVAACNEALSAGAGAGDGAVLPASLRTGIITLLYKGDDKPADQLASFRPITLLNTDYKLLARVLVRRLTPLVDAVTSPTQTAFVPGRWIGDNVLQHLEEVDYCQATATPGCILFLDFSQAYDRLARDWLFACMERMQFPGLAVQWVRLMLQGTQVRVRYHGWHTPLLPVPSGVAQGSPLSPLLWVLAAQPLSAFLARLQAQGRFGGIRMPDGGLAPPTHQHADDTSIHADSRASAALAVELGVRPFEQASNSRLNLSKCKGLELGSAEPFTGPDTEHTGVYFPGADDPPIRHLGILVSHDQATATRAMFAQRLRGLYAGIRHWAAFDLTYIGRLHVAKSVLASTLWYHATFVQPPADVLRHMVNAVNHFVATGALVEELGPVRGRPPGGAIEALPRQHGGLGRVQINHQIAALQAKVAAMATHPRRHPWKQLYSAALSRAHPSLGLAALVSRRRPSPGSGAGLTSRQLGYWRSLASLKPFRCVLPGRLTSGHVRAERLLHNARIAPRVASTLTALPAAMPAACTTVGQLGLCLASESEGVRAAAREVLACLPAEWREHALPGPSRAPLWEVSACGAWVRRAGAGGAAPPVLQVMPDHRLTPAVDGASAAVQRWLPACVSFAPCQPSCQPTVSLDDPGGHLRGVLASEGLQPYLLGPWHATCLDPNVWAVDQDMPLSHFVVSAARLRLLHAAARDAGLGYVPGERVEPRLWRRPSEDTAAADGLADLEAQQVQRLQRLLGGSIAGGGQRRTRTAGPEAEGMYDALWMHESPPRAHPRVRAAAALQAAAEATAAAAAVREDDAADWVAMSTQPRPWGPLYAALWAAGLGREEAHFAWRLLHAGIACGASALHSVPAAGPARAEALAACMCSAAVCAAPVAVGGAASTSAAVQAPDGHLETLTHAFWACPAVQPAVRWLWWLWQRIAGSAPPWTPATLVVGKWQPDTAQRRRMWLHLRIALLWATWNQRQRRRRTGQQFDASAVVALARVRLEATIRADYMAATMDLPAVAGLAQQWFRGRRRGLQGEAEFVAAWCAGGVLARVVDGGLVVCIPTYAEAAA